MIFTENIHSLVVLLKAWADLLRHATIWNSNEKSAPMLAYIAVVPLLVQTSVSYINYIDHLLLQVESGVDGLPSLQLMLLAEKAAAAKDDENLNQRERTHLQALDCMLQHDHKRALAILTRHLQSCPGDGLALSLALDIAHTVGDKDAALRVSGSVAAYWNERQGKLLRPSIPGYSTALSLIALGAAVGGRHDLAERLALETINKGEKLAGGIATWALAHVYDAEGRTAEGISCSANTDGIKNFENCGLLFFDTILGGYGVRFALDREERGRGRSAALRLYDNNYERLLDDSGFARGQLALNPMRRAPVGWQKSSFDRGGKAKRFVSDLFGDLTERSEIADQQNELVNKETSLPSLPSLKKQDWQPTCEDVLTWMPPTPQILSDATLLLLRLTLNGTISSQNYRWENLRNSWTALLECQRLYGNKEENFEFYPLVNISASLLASPKDTGRLSGAASRLSKAMRKMGRLLKLGGITTHPDEEEQSEEEESSFLSTVFVRDIVAEKDPDFWFPVEDVSDQEDWKGVLRLLSSSIDGVYDPLDDFDIMNAELLESFSSWDFDVRPFMEHAVVYAACKCGDSKSLSLARSICSRGVTLRPNSPEEWWRYSIVLGLLGDEIASEDALAASLAFGGGQGVSYDP
jgi:hypothetical protein